MEFYKNENLPSLDDVIEDKNILPSINEFIVEESINFENIEEDVEEIVSEESNLHLSEIIRLVNDVRKDIPDIPEIKYYDEELLDIYEKLDKLKNYLISLPEIKYYDQDIQILDKKVENVKESIPKFPSWVNEINEIPDFSWIGKTFGIIDSDFIKVNDALESIKIKIDKEVNTLIESISTKEFEIKIDVKDLNEKLNKNKENIYKELKESALKIWELRKDIKEDYAFLNKQIKTECFSLQQNLEEQIESINCTLKNNSNLLENYFNSLKEEVTNLPEIKYYDREIYDISQSTKNNSKDIQELGEIVKIIKGEQKQLQEGLLNISPSTTNSDPLTPLDQDFATLDDLKNHYKLFLNRIQQQLSTIGGGGAGFLKDLGDVDIAGITTDSILKWNPSSNKWIIGVSGSGAAESTWSSNSIGIHTIKNVGIGTTSAQSGYSLYVGGDTRIVGILTVGGSSITIDGNNNRISVGNENVIITNSSITIGSGVSISASASGINTAPNVLYVAKDGNDENTGVSIDNAFLTIKAAVGVATTGTIVNVMAGIYTENNPIEIPSFVSIVGDDLKTVTVSPQIPNSDLFHVRKGCYVANMTFINHIAPAAAIAFPTTIAENDGGGKWESPYIQNCTSNTTTGTGLRIDGNHAGGLKSIVCDSYTQYNQGGVGVAVTNEGFAQLVSVFTICCNEAITCYNGSQIDLTNSNSSFGTYGLVSDGVSNLQYVGIVTSIASAGQDNVTVAITTSTRPYDGQVVYFDTLYQSVASILVSAGGTGYTSTPTIMIDSPTGPNGETALAFATLSGDSISEITIISGGNQYVTTPNITISAPNIGINTATAIALMSPIYYTINSSTPITSGISTLTLDENLVNTISIGTTAYFHQVSRIVASSHTFEYVGSGNDITVAIPKNGGVTIQENEVVGRNGGKVVYTSTDQSGNFRIGDGLQINQNTGTISGRSFTKSLFSEITPFILALS